MTQSELIPIRLDALTKSIAIADRHEDPNVTVDRAETFFQWLLNGKQTQEKNEGSE